MNKKSLVQQCLEVLWLHGCMAWRQNVAPQFGKHKGKTWAIRSGPKGWSDIGGVLPDGRYVAVECKAGKDELSNEQRMFLIEVQNHRAIALEVRNTVDHLVEWLAANREKMDNKSTAQRASADSRCPIQMEDRDV